MSVKDRKVAFHGQPITEIVTRIANLKVSVRLSLPVCKCVFIEVKLKMFSIEGVFLAENVFREGDKYIERLNKTKIYRAVFKLQITILRYYL